MPNSTTPSRAPHPKDDNPPDHQSIIELHWMTEPDLDMHEQHGISAPALCGTWMEPDNPLAEAATANGAGIQYVSCRTCDILHHWNHQTHPQDPPAPA